MTPRSRWLILGFALLGLAFASSSAWVHYKLMTDTGYVSPCDVSATFNCSQVYLSPYGSIGGVSVAMGGVLWFGLVALISAFSSTSRGKASPAGAYVFALSTIGLAVILYLGYSSFFVLKTACLLCLGTYVAVLAIFIVSGTASTVSVAALPGRIAGDVGEALRDPLVPGLLVVFLGATAWITWGVFPPEGTRPQAEAEAPSEAASGDFASAWARMPRVDLGIPADGARVIVVKFNDYQCPGCRSTHEWYEPVLQKFEESHPGAVKYVLKDWPWDAECNFNGGTLHDAACEAAAAVRMARDRGKDKELEMEDWIYANQTATPDAVRAAAEKFMPGLNFAREYPQKLIGVRQDIADGGALGIRSTPTLFINGVRIEDLMPASYFEMAIQLELDKASGK